MRAQVVQVDQQLRLVSSPAYSPLDRDKALAEQNVSGFFFISYFIPSTFFISKMDSLQTARKFNLPPYLSVFFFLLTIIAITTLFSQPTLPPYPPQTK